MIIERTIIAGDDVDHAAAVIWVKWRK